MPVTKVELRDWHFFIFCHNNRQISKTTHYSINLTIVTRLKYTAQ